MSSSQPPGAVSGSGLAPGLSPVPITAPIPTGSVVVGSQVAAPSVVSAPGSGLMKNGVGTQSMEEEVSSLGIVLFTGGSGTYLEPVHVVSVGCQ
jgi:hypothetical protein